MGDGGLLPRAFIWLMFITFAAESVATLLTLHPTFENAAMWFFAIGWGLMVVMPFLAGLVWDKLGGLSQRSGLTGLALLLMLVLPMVMLVVTTASLIMDPPDTPHAWYVLAGVIVWNFLFPLGLFISRFLYQGNDRGES